MDNDEAKTLNNCDKNPFENAVKPLTEGFLKIYEPSLIQIEKTLKELTCKETLLLEQIHDENINLSQIRHSDETHEMFNKTEQYLSKLINIKKDMKLLHDKSVKLKKRALKLQQFKEKQEYIKQQKEAEIKNEQSLIGKPGTSNTQ